MAIEESIGAGVSALRQIRPDIKSTAADSTLVSADQRYGRAGTKGHGESRKPMPREKHAHGKYGVAR